MSEYVRLHLVPVTLGEARRFVADHHRHNDPPQGHRVSVGIADDEGRLRGVGILGHPISRHLHAEGDVAEVVRVATDGTPNANSMIYGALVRAAWAMGYRKVITYTLVTEPGTSLKAAGWRQDGHVPYAPWNSRPTNAANKPTLGLFDQKIPTEDKIRWVIEQTGRKAA